MDNMGYVYAVVSRDEARQIARDGLGSGPVMVSAEGEMLFDGIYFACDPRKAALASSIRSSVLIRFNIDNVSEIASIQPISNGDRSVDFVGAASSPFVIPQFEIDYRSPRMERWASIDGMLKNHTSVPAAIPLEIAA